MKIPSWLIPSVLLIVMIDQWVAATGQADPYKLTLIPFTTVPLIPAFSLTSAARGLGIMLAVSYGIGAIHTLITSKLLWARIVGVILLFFVFMMLVVETTVVTPYIVTSMQDTAIAKTLLETAIFGVGNGIVVYAIWALMVTLLPPLGVVVSALAGLAKPATEQAMQIKARSIAREPNKKFTVKELPITEQPMPPLSRRDQLLQQKQLTQE